MGISWHPLAVDRDFNLMSVAAAPAVSTLKL